MALFLKVLRTPPKPTIDRLALRMPLATSGASRILQPRFYNKKSMQQVCNTMKTLSLRLCQIPYHSTFSIFLEPLAQNLDQGTCHG